MKTVFIKPRFKNFSLHRVYHVLQKNPPNGYKIELPENTNISRLSNIASKNRSIFKKKIMHYTNSLPYIIYQLNDNVKIPLDTDLVYAAQHVISTEKQWVVDVELASALSGYSNIYSIKWILEKKLKSENCKAILAWSDWSKRTIVNSFHNKKIEEKIHIIRHTVNTKDIQIKADDDITRLLFVGAVNPGTRENIEHKGLYETVNAFLELQKTYGKKIHLNIRSFVPKDLKSIILKNNGITLYEKRLSDEHMTKLFSECDIFPHTSYEVTNLAILDAMSFGKPVIALDLFNTTELITNNFNGFLLKPENQDRFYDKNELPNENSTGYVKEMRKQRTYITKELKEIIILLIEDKKLRNKISKEARMTFEKGEFSMKEKNQKLEKIFDEATQ